MTIWSCDPGKDRLAVAISNDGSGLVHWVGFVEPWKSFTCHQCTELVLEKPVVYPHELSCAKANDLIDVAMAGAWLVGVLSANPNGLRLRTYEPAKWKGQLPKPVHHSRIWSVMSPQERALFPADMGAYIDKACHTLAVTGKVRAYSRKEHNLLDAVGLNFFHTGRTGLAGAPAR